VQIVFHPTAGIDGWHQFRKNFHLEYAENG